MTRALFHQALAELQSGVLELGGMVELAIAAAMGSLRYADHEWSRRVIEDDAKINAKRFEIEDRALATIATQAPVAEDLRALVTALHITVDLERMGDHAEGIARINLMMEDEPLPRKLGFIPGMADRATAMLRDSLQAYLSRDKEAALRICDADDEVDRLQDAVYHECIGQMIEDPSTVQKYTYHLWTAHNLERIADRTTNICERVVYLITGHMEEINVSKY